MLAVQFLKKKRAKGKKNESWGEKCLYHQSVTVFLLFYFSDNNDNTFILRHIQYFIHCLWETHAMFLCGRLLGTGEKKTVTDNSKREGSTFHTICSHVIITTPFLNISPWKLSPQ